MVQMPIIYLREKIKNNYLYFVNNKINNYLSRFLEHI